MEGLEREKEGHMCFDESSVHLEKPKIVIFIVNHVWLLGC